MTRLMKAQSAARRIAVKLAPNVEKLHATEDEDELIIVDHTIIAVAKELERLAEYLKDYKTAEWSRDRRINI